MKKIILGVFMSIFVSCSSVESKSNIFFSPCPKSPNCSIQSMTFQEYNLEIVKNKIISNITKLGGAIVINQNEYINSSFKSNFFKFEDITEFHIDMVNKTIHIKSAAQSGWYDFGVNSKRIEKLILLFNENIIKNKE
ncbi:MAG: DUF1499 domain-containing protein [Fusobacteriaceae bacterium]